MIGNVDFIEKNKVKIYAKRCRSGNSAPLFRILINNVKKTALHDVYRAAAFFNFLSQMTNIFAVFGYPFVYTLYLLLNKAR